MTAPMPTRSERWTEATRWRRLGLAQAWLVTRATIAACAAWTKARLAGRERPDVSAAIARTLAELKGPYAKVGQFAALRPDWFSAAAIGELRRLRDDVPPIPFEAIRRVVEAEWSEPLEARFACFEKDPIGAASIAQAHRARLHDGRDVVVKVQYPWLADSLETDLRWLGRAFRLSNRKAKSPRAKPLFDDFCDGLRLELDFRNEAAVAEEIARNLAKDPGVVVPEVVASHSGRRVLTVRSVRAVGLSDEAGLARLGVAPEALVAILTRAYAKQVFVDGLFHADPHPGNLLVVDEPGAREHPRLLFVDFGLSRRLDPELRRELRRGMLALLGRDLEAFLDGMERIDAIEVDARREVEQAVRTMFERIAAAGSALGMGGSAVLALKDEAVALLRETPGVRLPTDLLLYARTLSMVFGVARELAPKIDPLPLCLPALLGFLTEKE